MSNYPFVDSKQVIDTTSQKPFELIHQRFFNNISIATGWKESNDGLFNYYKDIKLPVKKGEDPITLQYSPEVIIPANANPNNRPSNFPYARTIDINTVRLYAYNVPNAADAMLISINMRSVGTNEGITNGVYEPSDSVLNTERISIQAQGTSFYVPIDDDNKTEEEVTMTIVVSAFRGTERIEPFVQNKKTGLVFNLDGTEIEHNEAIISDLYTDKEKPVKSVTITIPKGTIIKDRQAYILVGAASAAGTSYTHTVRSVIYTNKSDKNVSMDATYDVEMPTFTRKAGVPSNVYYVKGEPIGIEGYELSINATSLNGDKFAASGRLVITEKDTGNHLVLLDTQVNSGKVTLNPAIFDGRVDFEYTFYTDNRIVVQESSAIIHSESTIILKTEPRYVVPVIEEDKFVIPQIRVTAYNIAATGAYVSYDGFFKIETSEGETIDSPQEVTNQFIIPERKYNSSELPSNYKIEVYSDKGKTEKRQTSFLAITKEGETELPYVMDISPNSLIVPTSSDNVIDREMSLSASMRKGTIDVTNEWTYDISTSQSDLDSYRMEFRKEGNLFTLTKFKGSQLSVVIKVKATNKEDTTIVYEKEVVIAKLPAVDDMGNYTFVRYGDRDESGDIQFTVDPEGELPDGMSEGLYYGVAITDTPDVPPAKEFSWISISGVPGEIGPQGKPGNAYYIDGPDLIKGQALDGQMTLSPSRANYTLGKWSSEVSEPLVIRWTIEARGEEIEFYNIEDSIEVVFEELFMLSEEARITAEIDVNEFEGTNEIPSIITYTTYKDIKLIYTDEPEYYSKLVSHNTNSNSHHTFEVDAFGNPIRGTVNSHDTPVTIGVEAYSGSKRLEYKENLLEKYLSGELSGSKKTWHQDWSVLANNPYVGTRNYLLNSGERVYFEEQDVIPTTVGEYLPTEGGRNWLKNSSKKLDKAGSIRVSGIVENGDLLKEINDNLGKKIYLSANLIIPTFTNETGSKRVGMEFSLVRQDGTRQYVGVWNTIGSINDYGRWVRSIQLESQEYTDISTVYYYIQGTFEGEALVTDVKVEFDNFTEYSPAPEDFNNLKGKSYDLSQLLRNENILSLNGSFEEDDFVGLWLGNDKFVGFLDNQELAFDLTENYDDDFVIVKTLSEKGIIDNSKLEKGDTPTDWTPALEDLTYSKEFNLTQPLTPNTEHLLSLSTSEEWVAAWLGEDYFAGFVENGQLVVNDERNDNLIVGDTREIDFAASGDIETNVQDFEGKDLQHAHTYNLSTPIQPNKEYTLSLNTDKKWVGAWLGKDYFAGYVRDGELEVVDGRNDNLLTNSEYTSLAGSTRDVVTLARSSRDTRALYSGKVMETGRYTVSFEVKSNGTTSAIRIHVNSVTKSYVYQNTANAWTKLSYTFDLEDGDVLGSQIYNHRFGSEFDTEVSVRNYKVEKGSVATPYISSEDKRDTLILKALEEDTEISNLKLEEGSERTPYISANDDRKNLILKSFNEGVKVNSLSLLNNEYDEGYYELVNYSSEGSIINTYKNENDLAVEFVDVTNSNGFFDLELLLNGEQRKTHRFLTSTIVSANNKPPSLDLQMSRRSFKITSATLDDINNWENKFADYKNDFISQNSSITIYPKITNTNISSMWVSSGGGGYSRVGYLLQYANTNTTSYILPLNEYSSWHQGVGFTYVVAGKYYLLFSNTNKEIELTFYSGPEVLANAVVEESNYYMPSSGSYSGQKIALVKAPAGAETVEIKRDSSGSNNEPPNFFYFEPMSETLEILNEMEFRSGLMDISKFPSGKAIARYLPIGQQATASEIGVETNSAGEGYISVSPSAAINPTFFSNEFTDTDMSIRFKTVADNDEYYSTSISRSVSPFSDFDSIRSDLKTSLSGAYFYRNDLDALRRSLVAIKESESELLEIIEEDSKPRLSESKPPLAAGSEIFFPEREIKVGSNYQTVSGEYSLNIFESESLVEGENVKSVFGTTINDNYDYLLTFNLKHNLSGTQTIAATFTDMEHGLSFSKPLSVPKAGKTFKILIPKVGSSVLSADLSNYIASHFASAAGVEVFADRAEEVDGGYSTYYMEFDNPNVKKADDLIMSEFQFVQLRPSVDYSIPKYEHLSTTAMKTSVSNFSNEVASIVGLFDNLQEDKVERIDTPTTTMALYSAAEREIRDLRLGISKANSSTMDKSIFQAVTGTDSHIMGYNSATGWLSSLTISPSGAVMRGEKNQIIGSTSIGTLYGKKFVIGKTPGMEDFQADKEYIKDRGEKEGFIGIWDKDGRWSSVLNTEGQQFFRYDSVDGEANTMIGYMIMNSAEIAAYQLKENYTDVSSPMPPKVLDKDAVPIFRIKDNGNVAIRNLEVGSSKPEDDGSTVDMMGSIRFMKYERGTPGSSTHKHRKGVIIIGIGGDS